MSESLERAFDSAKLGSLELKNRFLKAATFEGKTPGGVPGQPFLDFHLAPVDGGIAMTNFAYCAAEADGRIYDHMMYMHDGIRSTLNDMIQQIHAKRAKVCGQLTHCGGFSGNKKLIRLKRPQGPSAKLSMIGLTAGRPFVSAMNAADIQYLRKTFGEAARFMQDVGFDAIEIHFGHGYALSQFLSPITNKRSDVYGGNLGNRMRLPLEVLDSVQSATGGKIPLGGKLSLTDGVEGGITEAEAIEFARQLDKAGIDALIVSDLGLLVELQKLGLKAAIHISTQANTMSYQTVCAYEKLGEQYLLIKSPPASGKSRALMFIAIDKTANQGIQQAIIVVPEKSIGKSFDSTKLSDFGYWSDWEVMPKWNLCNSPGEDGGAPRATLPPPVIVVAEPSKTPVLGLYLRLVKLPGAPVRSSVPVLVAFGSWIA